MCTGFNWWLVFHLGNAGWLATRLPPGAIHSSGSAAYEHCSANHLLLQSSQSNQVDCHCCSGTSTIRVITLNRYADYVNNLLCAIIHNNGQLNNIPGLDFCSKPLSRTHKKYVIVKLIKGASSWLFIPYVNVLNYCAYKFACNALFT